MLLQAKLMSILLSLLPSYLFIFFFSSFHLPFSLILFAFFSSSSFLLCNFFFFVLFSLIHFFFLFYLLLSSPFFLSSFCFFFLSFFYLRLHSLCRILGTNSRCNQLLPNRQKSTDENHHVGGRCLLVFKIDANWLMTTPRSANWYGSGSFNTRSTNGILGHKSPNGFWSGSSNQQLRSGGSSGGRIVYQICSKPGHKALDCCNRMNFSYHDHHPWAQLAAMAVTTMNPQSSSDNSNNFLLSDISCIVRMTNDLTNLNLSNNYNGEEFFIVSNNQLLNIQHTGSVTLSTPCFMQSDM